MRKNNSAAAGNASNPAADKARKPFAETFAAAAAGVDYPAADNAPLWAGLLKAIPAVAAAIAAARAGKYGDKAGTMPLESVMLSLSPSGKESALDGGTTKRGGKATAFGAGNLAVHIACETLKTDKVCGAAAIFFMLTDARCIAAIHGSKATQVSGQKVSGARDFRYLDRASIACPRWYNDYLAGNIRDGAIRKG